MQTFITSSTSSTRNPKQNMSGTVRPPNDGTPSSRLSGRDLRPYASNYDARTIQFPHFARPKIVGCFSVDGQRKVWLNDRRHLSTVRVCRPPTATLRVRFDLNRGLDAVIRKPAEASEEHLDHILTFILGNVARLRSKTGNVDQRADDAPVQLLHADIVCFRGLLRLLLCTPYETRSGWSILASRFRGSIYLCRFETAAERAERQRNGQNRQLQRIFSYGFKLEQYLTDEAAADRTAPVNEAEEFCCMFAGQLGGSRLLFGAEMDGVPDDAEAGDLQTVDLNAVPFAEIKLWRRALNQRQMETFLRHKTCAWWAQSFLVGVERIVVGERNDAGIVDRLREMRVGQLASDAKRFWSAAVCMEFANRFVRLVRDTLGTTDSARRVCRFDYDPRRPADGGDAAAAAVQVQFMDEEQSAEYRFLPDWYVNGLESNVDLQ